MWKYGVGDQVTAFLISLCFGAVFCLIYDALKIIRLSIRHKAAVVFFEDVIYWTVLGFSFYIMAVVLCCGIVRGFLLLGTAIGFLVFRFTLSGVLLWLGLKIMRVSIRIFRVIRRAVRKITDVFSNIFGNMRRKVKKFLKIFIITVKKGLKRVFGIVYNQLSRKGAEKN